MKWAVRRARLGQVEELAAIRRLDAQARRLEGSASGPSVNALLAQERARSHEYGGRSVFGWEPPAVAGRRGGVRPGACCRRGCGRSGRRLAQLRFALSMGCLTVPSVARKARRLARSRGLRMPAKVILVPGTARPGWVRKRSSVR
jgi:hypothetical protein